MFGLIALIMHFDSLLVLEMLSYQLASYIPRAAFADEIVLGGGQIVSK